MSKIEINYVFLTCKLWEFMWEKVGDMVVLEVARVELGTTLSITMVVGEATPNELNR